MKTKSITIFLSVLFFSSFLLFYCQKDNMSTSLNLEEKLEQYNRDKTEEEKGELTRGTVRMVAINDQLIGVLVQGLNADKSIMYALQSNHKQNYPSQTLLDAQVMLLGSSLFIDGLKSKERYLLHLEDDYSFSVKGIDHLRQYTGYGLNRIPAERVSNLDVLKDKEVISLFVKKDCTCKCYRSEPAGGCDAGGTGSTYCSVNGSDGCSTRCSADYLACCKCYTRPSD